MSTRDIHKKSLTPGAVPLKGGRGKNAYHLVDMGAGSFHSFAIMASKANPAVTKVLLVVALFYHFVT